MSMRLEEQNSPLRYFGFNLDQALTFKTMLKDMRSQVWAFWMNPEMRQQRQDLHLLKRRHQPQVWRFWHGTQAALFGLRSWTLGFRKAPKSSRSLCSKRRPSMKSITSSQAVAVAHPRAEGQCDYSLDGGTAPLDTTRELDLLAVSDADFTVNRLE